VTAQRFGHCAKVGFGKPPGEDRPDRGSPRGLSKEPAGSGGRANPTAPTAGARGAVAQDLRGSEGAVETLRKSVRNPERIVEKDSADRFRGEGERVPGTACE
jgi:hypothetical protein